MDKVQLKFDQTVKIDDSKINSLCVSDDKKLAYVYLRGNYRRCSVIDMNNKDKKIALDFDTKLAYTKYCYCTFNLNDEIETKNIGIFNNDIQLYNFMNHTGLFLLPSLFYYTPDKGIWNSIKYCWNNKYKNGSNQTLFDKPTDEQTKFVFGILNGRVWKSKFDEKMPKTNFSSEYSDELNRENNKIIEYNDNDKINKETYEHSNIHLYMDTVSTLFQKAITIGDINRYNYSTKLIGNLIKWDIHVCNGKIDLAVFNKHNTEWNLINVRIENYYYPYKYYKYLSDFKNNHQLIASSLFNNNDIVIKYMEKILQHYKRIFSKSTLPLPNYDSFRLNGWVSDVINNKSSFLKYGGELLKFAINEHNGSIIFGIFLI
ncbi:hypothetical protein GLOIN_2v1767492 [Rhizophagus irregularis DAOM 181602=DAOM 197198]|nr:hypothetical protein GLOIN_2v1767492 [Rhizophagus irregularis DAOM 181602=DAOM 197198]